MDLQFDVLPISAGLAIAAFVAPLAMGLGWRVTGAPPRASHAVIVSLAGPGSVALAALTAGWIMKAGRIVAFAAFFGLLPLSLFPLAFLLRREPR